MSCQLLALSLSLHKAHLTKLAEDKQGMVTHTAKAYTESLRFNHQNHPA